MRCGALVSQCGGEGSGVAPGGRRRLEVGVMQAPPELTTSCGMPDILCHSGRPMGFSVRATILGKN